MYHVAPWLIIVFGAAAIPVGALVVIFRHPLKRFTAVNNRAMWGDRIGDRVDAAAAGWLIVPGVGFVALGVLLLVFGIIGVASNAPVVPSP